MVWLMYLTFNLCPVMHVWPLHESLSLWRGLCNSMKLWDMLCRATQDQWVMVESSDKMLPIGGRNGKPLLYSCCGNPMNSIKRQKEMMPKDELPPPRPAHCRSEAKQKWHSFVDVSAVEGKIWCSKEQCWIGTWNVWWIKVHWMWSSKRWQEWALTS